MYGQVVINAVVFGVHGNLMRQFDAHDMRAQFIAGAAAGGVQSVVCSPMELIKIRLQMQGEGKSSAFQQALSYHSKFEYVTPTDCIRKIYKYENGFRGVFKGMYLTLWREVPSFGFYFASYYYLCDKLGAIYNGDIKIMRLLFCGGVAGIISWVSTYPFDVIKTRVQSDHKGLYKGSIDCARRSYQHEGFTVFFRGMNATLIRAFPGSAATLATVSIFLNFVNSATSNIRQEDSAVT